MSWITTTFPGLGPDNVEVTSECDGDYNCIAWAAGDKTEWWTNLPGYFWPAKRSAMIESLVAVFVELGYKDCGMDASLDPAYEKVALYARNGLWKHAARQLPSGRWTSKLGKDEDVEHDSPDGPCGKWYGKVHCIMRRRKP